MVWVFRTLFPGFCFNYGILNIAIRKFYWEIENIDEDEDEEDRPDLTALDWRIATVDIVFLIVQTILYFSLVFLVEYFSTKSELRKKCEVKTAP